jgi:hypothetical protein
VNNGRANLKGIELEAKFPLRALINAAPAIDVRANLARILMVYHDLRSG